MYRQIFFIALQICIGFVLFYCLSFFIPDIPKNTNIHTWRNFTVEVGDRVDETSTTSLTFILILLHTLHLFFSMPFLYVTKMFYGYFLGHVYGFLICFGVEIILISLCTFYFSGTVTAENYRFRHILQNLIKIHGETITLIIGHMSSFPIAITSTATTYGGINIYKFIFINVCVSVLTTCKDIANGVILRGSNQAGYSSRFLAFSLVFSGVLPTLLCLYMTSLGIQIARTQTVKSEADSEQSRALTDAMSECEQQNAAFHDETMSNHSVGSNHSTRALVEEDWSVETDKLEIIDSDSKGDLENHKEMETYDKET